MTSNCFFSIFILFSKVKIVAKTNFLKVKKSDKNLIFQSKVIPLYTKYKFMIWTEFTRRNTFQASRNNVLKLLDLLYKAALVRRFYSAKKE